MADVDLKFVDEAVQRLGRGRERVIPILQAIQGHYRYLPREALERVCRITEITPASITGVSTFFTQFRHTPAGRHTLSICHGTACHVKGAGAVHEAVARHLKLSGEQDTDAEGLFTVRKVACLGCCTLAPVIQIDQVTYGHLTPDRVPGVLRDFLEFQARRRREGDEAARASDPARGEIRIGLGSCCQARGSGRVRSALERAARRAGLAVVVKQVGCVGMCHQTPLVEVVLPGQPPHLYAQVQPADAEAIVLRHLRPKGLLRRVGSVVSRGLERLLTDEGAAPVDRYAVDARDSVVESFLTPQRRIATEHSGVLDPADLDEYLARGGFSALKKCDGHMPPDRIIHEISCSGLRGRGGAGYPSGVKWASVRAAPGAEKHVICNGDEGDPGAFMDRMILESYPYRVIEGLAIAARAVGASTAWFFIRAEYPLALERVRAALEQCRRRGLLEGVAPGNRALGVRLVEGAGAFVCGEETALIASIEGRRGMPRLRPPYPSECGLWGRPTLINNVETYAVVPWIVTHGAEAFAAMGTAGSKGTKVFALAGKVARGGLVEVPMGVTLRQIIEDIGGGAGGGKKVKAVQVGGPSGGCVPESLFDTPIDYEALSAAGAIMGSGGLVVLDETDCMVEIARYFLEFTQTQSCGKCTFCRIGTRRMLEVLNRLCEGQARRGDIERLEQLAGAVQRGSLCGLGRTAPNPVLTTLRHFRDEYEAHLEKRCPAGRCQALIRYVVTDDCIGCTLCAQHCPVDAIALRPYEKHEIDPVKCVRCGTCKSVCPAEAVKGVPKADVSALGAPIESGPLTLSEHAESAHRQ